MEDYNNIYEEYHSRTIENVEQFKNIHNNNLSNENLNSY